MRFAVIFALALGSATPAANAQQERLDVMCNEMMPSLFKLVGILSDVPSQFDKVHAEMTATDKERFAPVKKEAKEFADEAEQFRKAFIEACYP